MPANKKLLVLPGDRFIIRKLTLSPPKPEAETECDGA